MTTASFSYLGWDADQCPYSGLMEGDAHATATLSAPLLSDAETVAALICGTSDSHLLAIESDLVPFYNIASDTPAFWDSYLVWQARGYTTTFVLIAGTTTTALHLQAGQQIFDGADSYYGLPVLIVYKNSSTDESLWTFALTRATDLAWSTDHWVLTVDTLTATPAGGDLAIVGAIPWTYDFWEQFAMGGSEAHELRLWINSALPNGSTQLYQLQEFVADDNRTMSSTVAATTSITSAKHGQRGWISLGKTPGTHCKVRLKGVTAATKMELRWVQVAYNVRSER